MLSALSVAVRKRPIAAAGLFLGTRHALTDLFAQTTLERRDWVSLNLRRTCTFASFGLLMGGGPVYMIFSWLLPRYITPRFSSLSGRVASFLFVDLCVFLPGFYFPVFYTIREFVHSTDHNRMSSKEQVSPARILSSAAEHYQKNVLADMKAACVIMFPTDVLLLTKVPPHLRVPFASVTGVVWVLFLSWTRGEPGN